MGAGSIMSFDVKENECGFALCSIKLREGWTSEMPRCGFCGKHSDGLQSKHVIYDVNMRKRNKKIVKNTCNNGRKRRGKREKRRKNQL